MSLFGANAAQPVQGIQSTPSTTRSNPDRKRREKQEKKKKDEEHALPHREEDVAELSAHDETPEAAPHEPVAPPADDPPRPHIDVQG